MITSTLAHLHWYRVVSPHFAKAIEYALATNFAALEQGKYEIDGDNAFAIVNEYTTKSLSECDPESHRQYADIQIMVKGAERFGYMPLTDHTPSVPFQSDNDVAFYSLPEDRLSYITLYPGQFIIFFPSDIHQPEVFVHRPSEVKKVVIKVKVSQSHFE